MATALSSWMHVSICGVLLPRSFTRLSCSPRKLAPGTSATYGTSSRCSMRAIASLPQTSVRAVDGLGVSGTMGGTGLLGVIGRLLGSASGGKRTPAGRRVARRLQIFESDSATAPESLSRPCDSPHEVGMVLQAVVEPVFLAFEPDEDTGRLSVPRDEDLFGRGQAEES